MDCNDDYVFEKDLADAVLAALQQQVAFADVARNKLKERAERLAPSVEKLQNEITRFQRQIDKSKTVKMGLWEKFHMGNISAECFQRENEKIDTQVAQSTAKIPEIQARIRELETKSGQENAFVEWFSKHIGIQELTRAVVEEFINVIKVYAADRIEIVFNYADEYVKVLELMDVSKKKRRTL
jgi:chromosome segregation ATPase